MVTERRKGNPFSASRRLDRATRRSPPLRRTVAGMRMAEGVDALRVDAGHRFEGNDGPFARFHLIPMGSQGIPAGVEKTQRIQVIMDEMNNSRPR